MPEIVTPPLGIPRCAEDKPQNCFVWNSDKDNPRQQSSELLPTPQIDPVNQLGKQSIMSVRLL
jgi:hypothetical protein